MSQLAFNATHHLTTDRHLKPYATFFDAVSRYRSH